MAGFPATEAVVSALMKEVYSGAVTNQLNEEVGPWAAIEKNKESVTQGAEIVRALRVGRNQGIGVRGDNERLPSAGRQRHVNTKIKMASTYIVGEFTGRVVRDTYTNQAAFEQVMENEMKNSLLDFTNDIARQVSTGHGRLATVNANAASGATAITVNSLLNLGVNQRIVIFNGTTERGANNYDITADTGGFVITAVNYSTNQITITPALGTGGVTSGDFIYRAGNYDSTGVVKEIQGLTTIVDDGTSFSTYFGLTRSAEDAAQANLLNMGTYSSGAAVTDADFEDAIQFGSDQVTTRSGKVNDLYYTDFGTRRRYLKRLQSQRQFTITGDAPTFAGGNSQSSGDLRRGLAEGLTFNGVPLIASRRIEPKTLFGLTTSTWEALEQTDVSWVMNGDSVLHSLLGSEFRDAYRFSCFKDMQVYCEQPNANIKYTNTY